MNKAIVNRRSMIEQAVQATLGAYGSWSHLSAILLGQGLENEADFLERKGVKESQLRFLPYSELEASQEEKKDDIIWVQIPDGSKESQSYQDYLALMNNLRDDTDKSRVIIVESGILGFKNVPDYGKPEISIKQLYLKALDLLEEKLGKEYVKIHDQLIKEIREENYEKRLVFLYNHEKLSAIWKEGLGKEIMVQAQLRSLVLNHSSKTFESGFISGHEAELEQLLKQLKPKMDWNTFREKVANSDKDEELRFLNISEEQIDPELTEVRCKIWNELEDIAGKQFDYLCNKTFNKLSNVKKYQLTGESRYEEDDEIEAEEQQKDLSSNFRQFQVDSNPLSSLMGGNFGANTLGLGGNNPLTQLNNPPVALTSTKKISLEEYGEVYLAMISAWMRNRVTVGGALFEYYFQGEESLQVGSIIALSTDEKLHSHVLDFGKALGLGTGKTNPDELLKSFFTFNKNYIKFYDKVRAQLKVSFDQYIGSVTSADYEEEARHLAELENKFKVDTKAKKEREKKLSQLSKSSLNARLELLKKLKDQGKPKGEEESISDEEKAVEVATIEISLTEDEIEKLNKKLEERRIILEEKIELDKMKRQELEEAIKREQDIREEKREELEQQRQKKREAEKADFNRRQQRLAEERKKREEVKKMRAKSLREAFDRAREAAIRKQGTKGGKEEDRKDDKKTEKKKYNPEAVKMMIRFGTDDRKIMSTTGISEIDLVELKATVSAEDSDL